MRAGARGGNQNWRQGSGAATARRALLLLLLLLRDALKDKLVAQKVHERERLEPMQRRNDVGHAQLAQSLRNRHLRVVWGGMGSSG